MDPSVALSSLNELKRTRESETAATRREEFFKSETLSAAVEALISDSRQSLIKTAESYYSSKKADEITRKGRIPADAKTMKEQIEETLSGLSGQADEHSSAMLSDVQGADHPCEQEPGARPWEDHARAGGLCGHQGPREAARGFGGVQGRVWPDEEGENGAREVPEAASCEPPCSNLSSSCCAEEEERTVECKKVLRQFSTRILETAHGELRAKCNARSSAALHWHPRHPPRSARPSSPRMWRWRASSARRRPGQGRHPAPRLVSLQRYREFASADAQRSGV